MFNFLSIYIILYINIYNTWAGIEIGIYIILESESEYKQCSSRNRIGVGIE